MRTGGLCCSSFLGLLRYFQVRLAKGREIMSVLTDRDFTVAIQRDRGMALWKSCRDCGHLVRPRAHACPWCTTNKPTQKFLQRHPLIGFLVFGTLLYGAINVLAHTAEAGFKVLSFFIA